MAECLAGAYFPPLRIRVLTDGEMVALNRRFLAEQFVGAFEYVAEIVGRDRALADPRVQAARARYRAVCA